MSDTGLASEGLRLRGLLQLPPMGEREVRMEALIARLRLLVIIADLVAIQFFLDTTEWNVGGAWLVHLFALAYAVPLALLQLYRRSQVFRTSVASAVFDAAVIATAIGFSDGWQSPFFMLYYLTIVAMALRFDLRQTVLYTLIAAFSYTCVYFWTWDPGTDAFGQLFLRVSYMFILAVCAGNLAREESARSQQVQVIEKLNAENARLASRNERAARTDRLTGLLNRGYFEKLAHRQLRRARSANHYMSVLFCDLDRMKRINDELGHEFGDRILKRAASQIKGCLRQNDIVGRYGGDEFVVVLPDLTRETAFERGDELISAVLTINDGLPDDLHIGLSVGVAACPFDATDYQLLVRLADQAMYLAKRAGGNRVRTANDLRLFYEEIRDVA